MKALYTLDNHRDQEFDCTIARSWHARTESYYSLSLRLASEFPIFPRVIFFCRRASRFASKDFNCAPHKTDVDKFILRPQQKLSPLSQTVVADIRRIIYLLSYAWETSSMKNELLDPTCKPGSFFLFFLLFSLCLSRKRKNGSLEAVIRFETRARKKKHTKRKKRNKNKKRAKEA